jgi:HEAT repeat protein
MRTIIPAFFVTVALTGTSRGEEAHTFRGKTVDGWLAVFWDKSATDDQRREAVVMLGCFGPEARAAAPDLIDAVRNGPWRDEAVDALVSIGAGAEVTVPVLIDRFVKRGCEHLTGMGSFPVNISVDTALARVGEPAVPALLKILDGPDAKLRECAAYALGEIGPGARAAVPSLIRAIESLDPQNKPNLLAIRALGRIGPEARAAIPALNGWLDKSSQYYYDVVIALDRIGAPPGRKLVDRFLREGNPFVATHLAWLGPKIREVASPLRAALTDKRLQVRISAAVALAHIDPAATDVIPVLIEGLKRWEDEELDVEDVPNALARFGPRASAAMPELIGLISNGSPDTDLHKAVVQIDPEGKSCVPALIAALKDDDPGIVSAAANCLAVLGPRAKEAIPDLAATLTREFHQSFLNADNPQASAARALRRVDPQARSAIPALISALEYRHLIAGEPPDCRGAEAAAAVLGSYGDKAKAAVPGLIRAIRTRDKDDENQVVRHAAVRALGQIGPAARAAVPVLRDVMEEFKNRPEDQVEVVIALYRLAPDGKELAERWLQDSIGSWKDQGLCFDLKGRVMLLGTMGRTSLECDWVTRRYLDSLDSRLTSSNPRSGNFVERMEEWFELFGRLGVAGRLAIPRLKELQNNPSPFVRMWAAEALERIVPPAG